MAVITFRVASEPRRVNASDRVHEPFAIGVCKLHPSNGFIAKFRIRTDRVKRSMPITVTNPFKGRQYPGDVILQAVRWYLRYPLAYEHVSELLA